jgi:hypothetical protein
VKTPLIVNDGMGVDSMGMLIRLRNQGERPDLVIHADTGSEKPETVDYIGVKREWLKREGFPDLTIVRLVPTRVKHTTLEENCLNNETLPGLAFGGKSCSLRWKAEVMDRYLLGVKRGPNKWEGWAPAVEARAAGIKPVKCIGYDNGPKDSRRAINRVEDEHFRYRYPLREGVDSRGRSNGWDRERCIVEIVKEGLPVPVKSACFFCPASKPWELLWLAAKHPDLFTRALVMEDRARAGKHGLGRDEGGVKGLWGFRAPKGASGDGSWRSYAEAEGIVAQGATAVTGDKTALMDRAMAMKPVYEANAGLVQIGSCA